MKPPASYSSIISNFPTLAPRLSLILTPTMHLFLHCAILTPVKQETRTLEREKRGVQQHRYGIFSFYSKSMNSLSFNLLNSINLPSHLNLLLEHNWEQSGRRKTRAVKLSYGLSSMRQALQLISFGLYSTMHHFTQRSIQLI